MNFRPRFIYRKHLEPRMWDSDNSMRRDVRVAILTVIDKILQEVKNTNIPLSKSDIRDIFVHGSITNYYYNKDSDIDVCVVCDCSRVSNLMPEVDVALLLKLFAKSIKFKYKPRVCGRKLDIAFADSNWKNNRLGLHRGGGGMYSILKNKWLRDTIKLDVSYVRRMYYDAIPIYQESVSRLKRLIYVEKNPDVIIRYIENMLYNHSVDCSDNNTQPINPNFIAFRMVRSTELINRAHEHALKLRAKNIRKDSV